MTMTQTPTKQEQSAPRPDEPLSSELVASARLRAIEALRDGIEHELRSPLNAIVLNVELLKEMVRAEGGASAVVQLERLSSISSSISRLQCGLGELLKLTEERDETPSRFDLVELVAEVAAFVDGQLKQNGLRLARPTAVEALPIRGRREALRLALIHLLIHHMRACPADATIEIQTRCDEGWCVVELRTEGAAADREPRRADGDRDDLGLDVARQLIQREGGEVELAADRRGGSVVSARLPGD